ncbi:MAG: hypothetical protein GY772_26345 [bacterium]|nr:hypothetical protein [bacterium]
MIYQLTTSDFAALDAAFRLQEPTEYQRAMQIWFYRQNPQTGEIRPSYGLPNRSTPKTLALLLAFSRASLDLADQAAEEFGAAGLPLITDDTGYQILLSDLGKARARLVAYEAANREAIDRGLGETVMGDEEWFERVWQPVMSNPPGGVLDLLTPKILARAANVGKQAIDDAVDGLKSDLAVNTGIATGTIGLVAAAIGGLYLAVILRR